MTLCVHLYPSIWESYRSELWTRAGAVTQTHKFAGAEQKESRRQLAVELARPSDAYRSSETPFVSPVTSRVAVSRRNRCLSVVCRLIYSDYMRTSHDCLISRVTMETYGSSRPPRNRPVGLHMLANNSKINVSE